MSQLLDQSDYLARIAALEASTGVLANALYELTGERAETPACDKKECISAVNILEAHHKTLKDKIAGKHVTAASPAPNTAAPVAQKSGVTESANLTEQTIAAKQRAQEDAEVSKNQRQAQANQKQKTDGAKYRMEGEMNGQPFSAVVHPVKESTLTEKVLAARGCESLTELGARAAGGEFSGDND